MAVIKNMIFDNRVVLDVDPQGLDYYSGEAYRQSLTLPIYQYLDSTLMVVRRSAKQGRPGCRGLGPWEELGF